MGLSHSWAPTLHNNSPTPCTRHGSPLLPVEIPVGRSTISAAERPCASIQRRRSWMILDPQSWRCGMACVSFYYRLISPPLWRSQNGNALKCDERNDGYTCDDQDNCQCRYG